MSSISFDSPSGSALLRGAERHYAADLCVKLALATIGISRENSTCDKWVTEWLRPKPEKWALQNLYITLNQTRGDLCWVDPEGEPCYITETLLNTAVAIGGEALCLLAKLHGYSEAHCYVEGPDRAWLAQVIAKGRENNVLRASMGWEEVAAFLVTNDKEPVVCSFSVCAGFPDDSQIHGVDYEEWEVLSESVQWETSMKVLRATPWLAITPANLTTHGFANGRSLFDLAAMA